MYKRLLQWSAFAVLTALAIWSIAQKIDSTSTNKTAFEHSARFVQVSSADGKGAIPAEAITVDETWRLHLINQPVRWGIEERSKILALEPSLLLELLNDDALLVREDARDLVQEIYGACGVVLAVAHAVPWGSDAPLSTFSAQLNRSGGGAWCKSLLSAVDDKVPWAQIKKLLDLAAYAEPLQISPGERAESRATAAAALGDGSLSALLLEDDALQVAAVMSAMHESQDPLVINDWSFLQKLDQTQQNAVWTALWRGLDCQWTGNCSETSLPVSALCNSPNFQCDAGADYYSIVRRSLSPAQFEALMVLMNGVTAYRQQYGG